jgi:Carboxypeptidase regulatory-like domain
MWILPPDTKVEVIGESAATRRPTGNLDSEGIFRFTDVPPGRYSIRITAPGYRDLTLHGVTVEPGVLKDIGSLHLVSPCEDTPNTVCVGSVGLLRMTDGSGKLEMIDLCAVDLYAQEPTCTVALGMRSPVIPEGGRDQGFWFHTAADGAWLTPFEGTEFSLNPSTVTDKHGCVNATYQPGRIRINDLPPGSRACVTTRWGRYFELLFIEKIESGQENAAVKYVPLGATDRPVF